MRVHMQSALQHLTAAVFVLVALSGAAFAQSNRENAERLGRLEQELLRLQQQMPVASGSAGAIAPVASDASSDVTVRILALERVVEQLTGQIEETRFTSDRTAKQVQVLQDDISLRLARIEQALGLTGAALPAAVPPAPAAAIAPPVTGVSVGPQGLVPPPVSPPVSPNAVAVAPSVPAPTGSVRTPAFSAGDPLSQPVAQQPRPVPAQIVPSAQPAASTSAVTGAPVVPAAGATSEAVAANGGFVIRTDAAGNPLPPDPNLPQPPPPAEPEPPPQQLAPRAAPAPGPVTTAQVGTGPAIPVSLPDGTPKEQYDFAFEFLKRQDYPRAESTLRDFLKRHPKDPLAGNAQYWLGETYYVRGDFQQAAVEFMAGYQNYPKTNKGPDNLLKLGMSMAKLNQTQGACTALGRINKDYPDALDAILAQAKAERARLKCKV